MRFEREFPGSNRRAGRFGEVHEGVEGVVRQIVVSLHLQDFFLLGASSSVWDCRLIRRPAKEARRRHEPSSAGLQAKAFGHQKIALESTLPPHNDGVARRVSERIESSFHPQSEFQ